MGHTLTRGLVVQCGKTDQSIEAELVQSVIEKLSNFV